MSVPRVRPAALRWDGDRPYSVDYHDIYHVADGAAEVQRVFVHPSRLERRFAALPARDTATFTVGELGFGSGLNFAVIAQRFLELAPSAARLHYISVERHPFSHTDFARCAAARVPEQPVYAELAAQYPPLLGGWHRRFLAAGRIALSLYLGAAEAGLADLDAGQRRPVDAWLLDGFAPDRNPAMWHPALLAALGRLSAPGTSAATFTAAGQVRRDLEAAGFRVERLDQRPHKRHSLAGTFTARGGRKPFTPPRRVSVIGGGLAGSATAQQLAQRGVAVDLWEAHATPVNALPAVVLHPRLSTAADPNAALRERAFGFASPWLEHHGIVHTGVLQLPGPNADDAQLAALAERYAATGPWLERVDASTASAHAGLPLHRDGLYFPGGGRVDLALLCAALRDHARIDFHAARRLNALQPSKSGWRLQGRDGRHDAEAVVLCTGPDGNAVPATRYLELAPVLGQMELTQLESTPRVPLIGAGFVAPLGTADALSAVGATYEYRAWDAARATRFNLERLRQWWAEITAARLAFEARGSARGVRAVTSDRLPVVGAVYDEQHAPVPNLWLNLGHASSGTSTIPLAAECLASAICGELLPIGSELRQALDSLRFRQRQQRRGLWQPA